jgi:hypothetical protein
VADTSGSDAEHGLRFDQMNQFVSANQVSPRIALIYKPFSGHELACRGVALLHPADAGAVDAEQPRPVSKHDATAGDPAR